MLLKPALRKKAVLAPNSWAALPSGQGIKEVVENELQPFAEKCFGYHLVKMGHLSGAIQLDSCQIRHQIVQVPDESERQSIQALPTALPYKEKSIDAFLLGLELEFCQDPHQVLREIDRCLVPNGHVIVVGFNPFSLANISRWLPLQKSYFLRQARFFSRGRVKDWLSLLGYQVTNEGSFLFSDLVFDRQISIDSRFQRFAKKYLWFFSSLYVIVAKKQEFPLSLVKPPVWKPKPKFAAVGASVRSGVGHNKKGAEAPL